MLFRSSAEAAEEMIEYYQSWHDEDAKKEADPEWARDNMEYDLRSCEWMVAKVRAREEYAQNLYAAMCNRDFVKNDVWPLLKHQTWSCSWRYAGGIVAHMAGQGDYIDWYCSGIQDEDARNAKLFAPEGYITDEIRKDLKRLGWVPAPGGDWENFND